MVSYSHFLLFSWAPAGRNCQDEVVAGGVVDGHGGVVTDVAGDDGLAVVAAADGLAYNLHDNRIGELVGDLCGDVGGDVAPPAEEVVGYNEEVVEDNKV